MYLNIMSLIKRDGVRVGKGGFGGKGGGAHEGRGLRLSFFSPQIFMHLNP